MKQLMPSGDDDVIITAIDGVDTHGTLRVSSPRWRNQIENARSFAYTVADLFEQFTARKERRAGHWYWYAYTRVGGKFHRAYLGKVTDISAERLRVVAVRLARDGNERHARKSTHDAKNSLAPLLTKLMAPSMRAAQLVPTHALDQMQRVVDYPLTLVSGPAGWGKTTLLAQWIGAAHLQVAWVSLDAEEAAPARFWSYVLRALDPLVPGLARMLWPKVQNATPQLNTDEMTELINLLLVAPDPTILVLDNYQLLAADAPVHAALAYLVAHLPANVHIVLASRTDPPLPLAQLRAHGHLNEVRAADIRFTREEAARFISLAGIDLTESDLAALDTRIAGWITGWQLAALALRRTQDTTTRIAAFNGGHRYVTDFLTEEVLKHLPPMSLTFLQKTAILEHLTGPLCDAVTASTGSQQMLAALKQANLFIEATDDHQQGYRYHPLFADMLRHRLRQTDPGEMAELYQRASVWHAAQGDAVAAVEYAVKADDFEGAAQIIAKSSEQVMARGDLGLLWHWTGQIPEAITRAHPRLSMLRAYLAISNGQIDGVAHHVQDAEARSDLIPPEEQDVFQGELLALRATVAAHQGKPQRCITLCHQAAATLPEGHILRNLTLLDLGIAYSLLGDVHKAAQKLDALRREGESRHNACYVALSTIHLAHVRFMQGRLRESLALCQQLEAQSQHYDISIEMGNVLYEFDELTTATHYLQHGVDLRQTPQAVVRGYSKLADIQQAQGDPSRALSMIERAIDAAQEHQPALIRLLQAQRARIYLAQGDVAMASRWAHDYIQRQEHDKDAITIAHERITLARLYHAQGKLHEAHAVLAPLRDVVATAGHMGMVIEILTLQALISAALDDMPAAFTTLHRALTLAEPEGFVRVFVDNGSALQQLLLRMRTESQTPSTKAPADKVAAYREKLLRAFGMPESAAAPAATLHRTTTRPTADVLIDPLSARELEVLRLLAEGASNRKLASDLVIAVGTVKRHLSNIFMKLGVQSRTQAIARARALALLDLVEV